MLHGAGAAVVATARRSDRLSALADAVGDPARFATVVADVAVDDDCGHIVDTAIERFGRLDVLVNNAGTSAPMAAEDEPPDVFRGLIDVNVNGLFVLSQLAGRHMIASGGGVIVNVASMLGLVASAPIKQASYCASKGAVVNLTRELATQWARKGVGQRARPGWFPSEMTAEMFADESSMTCVPQLSDGPHGRAARARRRAAVPRSDASSYCTGQILTIDGGWTARSASTPYPDLTQNDSEKRAEEVAGARAFGVGRAELGGEEVGGAGLGQPLDARAHRCLVADHGDVGRTLGAFAVEHGAVARQLSVDREHLGARARGRGLVVRHAHRQPGDHAHRLRRPAAAAADRSVGTVCSASVDGPVIHVIVPSASRPVTFSICVPSAATRIGGAPYGGSTVSAPLVENDLALERHRLAVQQRPQDRQVLTHVPHGLVERQAPHRLDDDLVRQPDAEREPPAGRRLCREGLAGEHHRVAG